MVQKRLLKALTDIARIWSVAQIMVAPMSFSFEKTPILKRDFSLLTLKAWTSWERLSTANAIVPPTVRSKAL